MKRRDFLKGSMLGAAGAVISVGAITRVTKESLDLGVNDFKFQDERPDEVFDFNSDTMQIVLYDGDKEVAEKYVKASQRMDGDLLLFDCDDVEFILDGEHRITGWGARHMSGAFDIRRKLEHRLVQHPGETVTLKFDRGFGIG